LVDARDLKSLGAKSLYEFDSRPRHQELLRIWLIPNPFFIDYFYEWYKRRKNGEWVPKGPPATL
jgi:hypothetical protein